MSLLKAVAEPPMLVDVPAKVAVCVVVALGPAVPPAVLDPPVFRIVLGDKVTVPAGV